MTAQADFWGESGEAARRRDAGMARAMSHARARHPDWEHQARAALAAFRDHLGLTGEFQVEALRAFAADVCGVPDAPDARAWGGLVRGYASGPAPALRKVGTRATHRASGHGHPAAVWRFTGHAL